MRVRPCSRVFFAVAGSLREGLCVGPAVPFNPQALPKQRAPSLALRLQCRLGASAGARHKHSAPFGFSHRAPAPSCTRASQARPWFVAGARLQRHCGALTAHRCLGQQARQQAYASARSRDSGTTMWYMAALVVGAVGVSYASVPLYRMFCQVRPATAVLRPEHPRRPPLRLGEVREVTGWPRAHPTTFLELGDRVRRDGYQQAGNRWCRGRNRGSPSSRGNRLKCLSRVFRISALKIWHSLALTAKPTSIHPRLPPSAHAYTHALASVLLVHSR